MHRPKQTNKQTNKNTHQQILLTKCRHLESILYTVRIPTLHKNKHDISEITKKYDAHFIYSVSRRVNWSRRRLLTNQLLLSNRREIPKFIGCPMQ